MCPGCLLKQAHCGQLTSEAWKCVVPAKAHKGKLETTRCSLFGKSVTQLVMGTNKDCAVGAVDAGGLGKALCWVGELGGKRLLCFMSLFICNI